MLSLGTKSKNQAWQEQVNTHPRKEASLVIVLHVQETAAKKEYIE